MTPWYIGIAIVLLADAYAGYKIWTGNCSQAYLPEIAVLIVIPIVYLTLMYLTFTSQE